MKDTLDSLDMGYMGVFEAGHGRWSVGMDVVYGKVSDDFAAGGRLFRSFRYEQKQWLLTPFAAYRAVDAENVQLDIFAGARITILEAELTGRLPVAEKSPAPRTLTLRIPSSVFAARWGLPRSSSFVSTGTLVALAPAPISPGRPSRVLVSA